MRRLLLCLAVSALVFPAIIARADDSLGVPADATYSVQLRYQIEAGRAQRFRLYQAFVKRLAAAGIQKDKGPEGEELYGYEMAGSMPGSALPALLNDSTIQAAILTPKGFQPGDGDVLTRFYVTTALGLGRQREAADKAREMLKPLGFRENVGADTGESRRLLGRIPYAQLKELLKPSFEVPIDGLKVAIVKAAVVIAEPDGLKPSPEPAAAAAPADKALAKVSADLRALFADGGDKRSRVEVVLRSAPSPRDPLLDLQNLGLVIEGRLGPLVYGQLDAGALAALATLPEVSTIRLPQAARQIGASGVVFVPLGRELPLLPVSWRQKQHPTKTIVIASDFRGHEGLIGKSLPKNTRFFDFTSELSSDLRPEPPLAGGEEGDGTKLALQLAKDGGIEEMILARIDAAAPWQVEAVAQAVSGRAWSTPALATRNMELERAQQQLVDEKNDLRALRRLTLENFGIDDTAQASRKRYRDLQQAFDAKEKEVIAKNDRLLAFKANAASLKDAATVLIGLAWTDGYADHAGGQPTLRFLDPELLRTANWLQAVPVRGASVWQGVFRDENGDGVMEFAPDGKGGRRDMNFLAWKPKDGSASADLPAGAVVQLKLQWQEAHDARYAGGADDPYRQPIAPLKIVVLRQRDPSGKGVPADVFDVVARTSGLPDRVENEPRLSLYQTDLRFQAAQPGRYVVLIEGREPLSLVPAGSAEIKGKRGEIRPRLTAEAIDPAHRAAGQVIFETFASGE